MGLTVNRRGLRNQTNNFTRGLITALIAGFFAVSINAFAADAPKTDTNPAAEATASAAEATKEKPATPTKTVKHAKKAKHVKHAKRTVVAPPTK